MRYFVIAFSNKTNRLWKELVIIQSQNYKRCAIPGFVEVKVSPLPVEY